MDDVKEALEELEARVREWLHEEPDRIELWAIAQRARAVADGLTVKALTELEDDDGE